MRSLPRKAVLRHPALNPGSYADWEKCRRQLRPPNGRRLKIALRNLSFPARERPPAIHRPYPVKSSGSASISQNSHAADCLHSGDYPMWMHRYRLLTRRSVH